MSQTAFPVSKRNLSGGGAVRNSKKAYTSSLNENVAEKSSVGGALLVNLSDGIVSSCAPAVHSSVDDASAQKHSTVRDGSSSVILPVISEPKNSNGIMTTASPVIPLAAAAKDQDSEAEKPHSMTAVAQSALSPGANRQRFMENCQPLQVCCDLASVGMHNSSVRFSMTAIVLVVYPATKGPDRRHVQLIDPRGSTGLTIWNDNVRLFSDSSVGQVVKFTKLAMVFNNGKKSLSMGRDSSVSFISTIAVPTAESKWWQYLLLCQPLRIIDVHDCEDDIVISVAGIVGMISTERKRVKDQDRDLLCIRMTDRTGYIDIRSWSHSESEFAHFLEHPMLLQRVRVCSFAGMKTLELLGGSGTVVKDEFDGKRDLQQYWCE